ncbi:DUF6197 family protein [Mycobacterium paragordonae]|uniref:Uncharacterized protein n=1 Tax=Mycobacterium paragordonae TaxID=1389713 RepID=A0AAJ1RZF9_9MYCO|nr:hypothetical protein [Mycobacterium paragordonae]MDP7733687.1 hypothetical protein [Mycobacterium paragordonae]
MDILEILKNAKIELKNRGWGQGDLMKPNGNVCLLGAIGLASGNVEAVEQEDHGVFEGEGPAAAAALVVAQALGFRSDDAWFTPEPCEVVYNYNDETGRTEDDVLEALDKAIDSLKVAA